MATLTRTWWGERFIKALDSFTDESRLQRGRSYAGNDRILEFKLSTGTITAKVRGNVNPYFGVHKEPKYKVSINVQTISETNWKRILEAISSKAGFISKLLMNEIPENIETAFSGVSLLPKSRREIDTKCSCPDYANPCKHIAGVYYYMAKQFDHDPFLLFELRGINKDQLIAALKKTTLGNILASELQESVERFEHLELRYTSPETEVISETADFKSFWTGEKRLAKALPSPERPPISAIPIKKAGDYPAFWEKEGSFIGAMEHFYERVKWNKLLK